MAIKRIEVSNFRSFKNAIVTLGKYCVLIGPNASGKTTFVSILRFLRDIAREDLDTAISNQMGFEYLRNVSSGKGKPVKVSITVDSGSTFSIRNLPYDFTTTETKYELELEETGVEQWPPSVTEHVTHKCKGRYSGMDGLGKDISCTLSVGNVGPILTYGYTGPSILDLDIRAVLEDIPVGEPRKGQSILETDHFLVSGFTRVLREMRFYRFDQRASINPTRTLRSNKSRDLNEDGSNLPVVLHAIQKDEEEARKFSNLLNYVLPYLTDLNTEAISDDFFSMRFKETYSGDTDLPMTLISDGTVSVILLILALYYERGSVIVLEEPDIGIHPKLISKIMSMVREVSQDKQVILTTHNPELVRHSDLKSLLLAIRDESTGFSHVKRPSKLKTVREFLEHDIGIRDLYIDGLLEG